jgi:hypothetical protein
MGGEYEMAGVNPIDSGSDPAGHKEFAVPWHPSPLERLSTVVRRRLDREDWREVALVAAAMLLIGSSALEVVRVNLGTGLSSPRDVLAFSGGASGAQMIMLRPTLAVFLLACLPSNWSRLRTAIQFVLNWMVALLALLTTGFFAIVLHAIATESEGAGSQAGLGVAGAAATLLVATANVVLAQTDRTIG